MTSFGKALAQNSRLRPTVAVVDLDAIAANFRILHGLVEAGAFFCPMVKANAYGHGDIEVARALRAAGAQHLGVATIEEGLALREAGDRGTILVFGLFHDPESARELVARRLTPVVSDWRQLEVLEKAAQDPCELHLKFNTGMNRLGFAEAEAPLLRSWLEDKKKFRLAGICTHFLRGDDIADRDSETRRQLQVFARAVEPLTGLGARVHALNSAALVSLNRSPAAGGLDDRSLFGAQFGSQFGSLGGRPGIAIYGAQASDRPEFRLDLKPALTLKSQVMKVNRVKKGEPVSYGASWRAARDSWIGVLPIGYGDGVFRSLSNRGTVLCRAQHVPIAGVVCMDYLMIDMTETVRPDETPAPGDEVVLLGRQGSELIAADAVAALIGTISYEVFTRIGARVPRVYQQGGKTL